MENIFCVLFVNLPGRLEEPPGHTLAFSTRFLEVALGAISLFQPVAHGLRTPYFYVSLMRPVHYRPVSSTTLNCLSLSPSTCRFAFGLAPESAQFLDGDRIAYICGNSICYRHLSSGKQGVVMGSGRRVSCLAYSAAEARLASGEQVSFRAFFLGGEGAAARRLVDWQAVSHRIRTTSRM